jgi:hypothetical protein
MSGHLLFEICVSVLQVGHVLPLGFQGILELRNFAFGLLELAL